MGNDCANKIDALIEAFKIRSIFWAFFRLTTNAPTQSSKTAEKQCFFYHTQNTIFSVDELRFRSVGEVNSEIEPLQKKNAISLTMSVEICDTCQRQLLDSENYSTTDPLGSSIQSYQQE